MSSKDLSLKIILQGSKVRDLKAANEDKNVIKAQVGILLELKEEFKKAFGTEWRPGASVEENRIRKAIPTRTPETIYFTDEVSLEDGKVLLDAATSTLDLKIQNSEDFLNKLRSEKGDPDLICQEAKVLTLLKDLYRKTTGREWTFSP